MIDQIISNFMLTIQSLNLTKLMIFITHIGDKYTIAIFSIILLLLLMFHKKDYIKSKVFISSMALGVILSQGLKYIIQKPRPIDQLIIETGYSFPSGHVTLSFVFFGMLIYLFKDEIKNKFLRYSFIAINILLILLIGISRIYLNVHYFSDVIAGFVLGLICIFGAIKFFKK